MALHEQAQAAIDCIADTHRLSAHERQTLARIVTGAIPGNRDRPLFLLAIKLFSNGDADLLSMIMPAANGLRRIDTALLDFLLTVALDSAEAVSKLFAAFDAARCTADPARALTPSLAAVLHAYRLRVLPETRYHNVFTAVRRFLAGSRPEDPRPRDGDAPRFWVAEGRRDFLTRYVTALQALADFAEAALLADSWRYPVSLDDPDPLKVSSAHDDSLVAEGLCDESDLRGSLEALVDAPIKLLLAHEREALGTLICHAALVLRWPGDVQAALTFGPVQATITQALRRNGSPVDLGLLIDKGPSRQDVLDRIAELDASLSACLHLIHQSITPASEIGSARSSLTAVDTRRIAAMKRRQDFTDHSIADRNAVLTELIEPVLLFNRLLQRYKRALDRLGPERGATLEQAHREMFLRKFSMLYPEGQKE